MTFIDLTEIGTDFLTDQGVVLFARYEHDDRHKTIKAVNTRQNAHARPVDEVHDLFAETDYHIIFDLEQIITRIGFQRVLQNAAGVAVEIEAEMAFHCGGLGAQEWDLLDRACIGRGREQADDTQFADDIAICIKTFDADVIHIRTPMYNGFDVGFGDDQEIRAIKERQNFRCCCHSVLAETQNPDIRIGQNAEAGFVTTLDLGMFALAGIGIVAHA
ncbi:hypothetical protein D3C80_1388030 [compost metagenome]